MLSNPSLRVHCRKRSRKPKHRDLEQRKFYCRAKQGEQVCSKDQNALMVFREEFLLFCFVFFFFYYTILYWFCHTSTWIRHGYTHVPHPEPLSNLPPHTIPLGHPSAPAPSILYHASNLYWWFVSYMILYMFQCHFPISSRPRPLPQSPKDCSIHLYLFCCLAYRVIITILKASWWRWKRRVKKLA